LPRQTAGGARPNPGRARACSSVTGGTAGELVGALNAVALEEFLPEPGAVRRRPPGHAEDRLPRPQVRRRVAVAVETPLHEQGVLLVQQWHFVHPPVAGDAADALGHVDAVVEVDEARQVVDPLPGDRPAAAVALAHRLQRRAAEPDLLVAIHT